jgi:hypothetical protein
VTLLRFAIERTHRGVTPAKAITAPLPELAPSDPDKGLLPQREAQFAQSAKTKNGVVAPYVHRKIA